jgi:uncharacterized protein
MDLKVEFEKKGHRGAFFIDGEGGHAAELTFSAGPRGGPVILDHTEVSDALRGKGVARILVEAAVQWARRENIRLVPVCPFAKAVFDRVPAFRDVLA